MKKVIGLFCLLAAMASVASASQPALPANTPAHTQCMESKYETKWPVCKVASGHIGYMVLGTGVTIGGDDKERFILTAAHVVSKDAKTAIIADRGSINVPCEILDINESHDIALLSAKGIPCSVGNMPLAPDVPTPGQSAAHGGYSPDTGQFRQYEAPVTRTGNMFTSQGVSLAGMSGGPVYTSRGLVGIITGQSCERDNGNQRAVA